MRRPQFTLKTLLWLMALVAAFCCGIAVDRQWLTKRAVYVDCGPM
jgi:hypothetical protein